MVRLLQRWEEQAEREKLVRLLQGVREKLIDPHNIQCAYGWSITTRLCIAADFRKHSLSAAALFAHQFHKRTVIQPAPTLRVLPSNQFAQPIPAGHGIICGMKDVTTTSFNLVVPHSSTDDLHERIVAVVAMNVLKGFEGPLWRAIRGKGLSYDFSVYWNMGGSEG